jgi:hypothetical protein
MTHSLHRRGSREALARDLVFTSMPTRTVKFTDTPEKMREFYRIVLRHNPTMVGDGAKGNQLTLSMKLLTEDTNDITTGHAVFRDSDTVVTVLKELIDSGYDRSVVISGLFDQVAECCGRAGIGTPHTLEYSLGTWGRTEKLPPKEDLEVITMCGHAQVPASLVHHMAEQVKEGRLTAVEAGLRLGRQCPCGIFNVARAAELVAAMAARSAEC